MKSKKNTRIRYKMSFILGLFTNFHETQSASFFVKGGNSRFRIRILEFNIFLLNDFTMEYGPHSEDTADMKGSIVDWREETVGMILMSRRGRDMNESE
jgi:hypothetical protein